MKVLIITRPFVFHGGVEQATAGLVGALVEHGHDVHVASPPGQQPASGVTLHRLAVPRLPGAIRVLALALTARGLARGAGWDIVQSHERTLFQDIYRAGEGCHRAYLASRPSRWPRGLYHRIVLALERRVFARTPHIVAIARAGKREIEALYGVPGDRVSVVYNGVDLARFNPKNRRAYRAPAREEAGIPAQAWVVLFVGSGFERKGLRAAVEGFAAARVDRNRHLVVVGKGDVAPYRMRAMRLGVADRVTWLGARPDVERWYAAADAVLLPSRYEPFGNVHLEALASGIPVIASVRAGGSEVIEEGVNGHVVDPADPEAIAEALERLRGGDALARSAAARRSAEPFTYGAQVAALEGIYRDVRRPRGNLP